MSTPSLRRTLPFLSVLPVLFLAACSGIQESFVTSKLPSAGRIAIDEIDATVLLIGDAGARDEQLAPVLATLTDEAARLPGSTLIAFLGDNAYPWGIPDPIHDNAPLAKARLRAQLDAALDVNAKSLFIPGNHDWGTGESEGVANLQRMETFLELHGGDLAIYAPKPGEAGPVGIDIGDRVRLLILDTHLLIESIDDNPAMVDAAMQALVRAHGNDPKRHVMVLGHHPLASHGPHGGFHSGDDQLSMPVIGSVKALARSAGITNVDMAHSDNQAMREALTAALQQFEPLVYASGHEHSLQLLDGDGHGAKHLVVSGAGSPGEITPVTTESDTVIAAPGPGFFRMDFMKDGRVRLEMIALSLDGTPTTRTAVWIAGPFERAPAKR